MSDEEHIFMARVAEQAERYSDMIAYLVPLLESRGTRIAPDERNLLSVAFKSLVQSRRAAWRTLQAVEQNPKYQKYSSSLLAYKHQIETGLY